MKKTKCLVCGRKATIQKEVLIALKHLQGQYKSTNKILNFCDLCFPNVTPVIICD
jgi:hypothetical protein